MSRTHRRIQDGGDPRQGPAPEFANRPPSPKDVDDLPDRPEDNAPGHEPERDQDQPDPDAFAERLGLADRDSEPAGTGTEEDGITGTTARAAGAAGSGVRRFVAATLGGAGRAAGAIERALDRLATRVRS